MNMMFSWLLLLLPLVTGRPNFLILYADDLGIGDVGCFGNDTIRTPHIDSICKRGLKLSHHLTAAATCTPSRTALMTGRYPIRAGLASNNDLDAIPTIQAYSGLPSSEITFPKLLQNSGYNTGLIGKWHIGLHSNYNGDFGHHPTRHGFSYFFGTPLTNSRAQAPDRMPFIRELFPTLIRNTWMAGIIGVLTGWFIKRTVSNTVGKLVMFLAAFVAWWQLMIIYYGGGLANGLWRNEELVEQPIDYDNYMTQRLVKEGLAFLRDRKEDQKPFFLMMSWFQVHTFLHAKEPFAGRSQHGRYGDEVEEMDWGVGEMLKGLEKFGFKDNTLVYFSSDNGGQIEEHEVTDEGEIKAGGSNGIYRGGKVQGGMDGGIRVPTAISWPGHLTPGSELTEPTSQMDLFPTFLSLAGVDSPTDRVIDGRNILSLLKGEEKVSPHRFLMHYCCDRINAVRYRPEKGTDIYKVHYIWPDWDPGNTEDCGLTRFACNCYERHFVLDQPKLFNIATDPGEKHELDITNPKYKRILETITQAKVDHTATVVDVPCQYDRWYSTYRPWMHYHTCCGWFPKCSCKDPNNALHLKL